MQVQTNRVVGIVISGQYLVEDLLGTSSSGATYLVKDLHARDVPSHLFVLKEVVEPNKQARHRLASEGKLLRRFHHRGFPRVYHVHNDDKNKRVYVLMEYIAGQDLETLRQQQLEKLFSWTDVMHILAPIIAVMTSLHGHQPPIMHGDIKPANIVMPRGGSSVMLVDFGMMKACDPGATTAADRSCYRAPEQYNGSVDLRADIYALGATFYTLVTGQLPPDAFSRSTRVGNKAMDPLEPVNNLVPAIPLSKGKAIERAMSLDAQHRFSSVEQFWEALWRPEEHPAPVVGIPSVPKGPPAVHALGSERAVGQASEKLVPKPPPGVHLPGSDEEEDPTATVRLPKPPPGVHLPESDEEEDPTATVRLPKPPANCTCWCQKAGGSGSSDTPSQEWTGILSVPYHAS